jgi:hypothetical protein
LRLGGGVRFGVWNRPEGDVADAAPVPKLAAILAFVLGPFGFLLIDWTCDARA